MKVLLGRELVRRSSLRVRTYISKALGQGAGSDGGGERTSTAWLFSCIPSSLDHFPSRTLPALSALLAPSSSDGKLACSSPTWSAGCTYRQASPNRQRPCLKKVQTFPPAVPSIARGHSRRVDQSSDALDQSSDQQLPHQHPPRSPAPRTRPQAPAPTPVSQAAPSRSRTRPARALPGPAP